MHARPNPAADRIKIIEEVKELEHTKTEEALQLVSKEHDLWVCQTEKEEAKRLHGARKPRKDEETAWAPPRNKVGLAGLGRGDKDGRKRVEAGA